MERRKKIEMLADLLDNEFIPALAFIIVYELSDMMG